MPRSKHHHLSNSCCLGALGVRYFWALSLLLIAHPPMRPLIALATMGMSRPRSPFSHTILGADSFVKNHIDGVEGYLNLHSPNCGI